jgi:hypothetical protein
MWENVALENQFGSAFLFPFKFHKTAKETSLLNAFVLFSPPGHSWQSERGSAVPGPFPPLLPSLYTAHSFMRHFIHISCAVLSGCVVEWQRCPTGAFVLAFFWWGYSTLVSSIPYIGVSVFRVCCLRLWCLLTVYLENKMRGAGRCHYKLQLLSSY